MDPIETITKPWREPMDYLTLVFWFVIFVIAAYALWDGMKILGSWVASAATE